MKLGQSDTPKNPACWGRDAQAQCLRIVLADGSVYIFPYNHFAFVRFEPSNGADMLRVAVDSHEIQITGKNLCEVALAFQKLAVDWVKELPRRYTATANDESAYIATITISEIQTSQSRDHNA